MVLGANCVVIQDDLKSIRDFTGGTLPVLALNSIGGVSALSLIETLADNGTMVMFGAMAGERVRFPTRELLFRNVQLRGFWLDYWIRTHTQWEYAYCLWQIFSLLQSKKLVLSFAETYPLNQWQTALAKAQQSNLNGKVLFI